MGPDGFHVGYCAADGACIANPCGALGTLGGWPVTTNTDACPLGDTRSPCHLKCQTIGFWPQCLLLQADVALFYAVDGSGCATSGGMAGVCERATCKPSDTCMRPLLSAPMAEPTAAPTVASTITPGGRGDPHILGLHGGRYDFRGKNDTIYCVFSSRDVVANVLFLHDTFFLGGTCQSCRTKIVRGSFMKVRWHVSVQLAHHLTPLDPTERPTWRTHPVLPYYCIPCGLGRSSTLS
jgi:hypothetical protein